MLQTDQKEIRKLIKKAGDTDGVIDWIYSFYADSEGQVVWENAQPFSSLEEGARFRVTDLMSAVVGAKIGTAGFLVPLDAPCNALLSLSERGDAGNAEPFAEMRGLIEETCKGQAPYFATLARVMYDVPRKASDGVVLEDGETVFTAVLGAVCPSKLSSPALGLDNEEITDLSRRWTVHKPVSGFLYPAFADRGEDRSQAWLMGKTPETDEYLAKLFQVKNMPAGAEKQKEVYGAFLSAMSLPADKAAEFQNALAEETQEADDENQGIVTEDAVCQAAVKTGIEKEETRQAFRDTASDVRLSAGTVLASRTSIQTGEASVSVPSDKSELVSVKQIDGVLYLCVPVDGPVSVNGAASRPEPDGTYKKS